MTVTFAAEGDGTRVTVVHDEIATGGDRDGHALGWQGCLDGLADHYKREKRTGSEAGPRTRLDGR